MKKIQHMFVITITRMILDRWMKKIRVGSILRILNNTMWCSAEGSSTIRLLDRIFKD